MTNNQTGRGYRLNLEKVCFRPSSFISRFILKDVNLSIKEGDFVAIVGANGAGKSTLLRIVAGEILQGVTGNINVAGTNINRPIGELLDGVGIVHQFEDADLIEHLTVAQNVAIRQILGGGSAYKFFADTPRFHRDLRYTLNTQAGLPDFALDELVKHLAGGLKQMLSVAISINLEHHDKPCRLLLLDEHTSRLDLKHADEVMKYTVDKVKEAGATTLMVTHRLSDALKYATRILVIVDENIKEVPKNGNGVFDISVEKLSAIAQGEEL